MELIPIENKIYEIRGRRVMLDFDLAGMYGIENKNLKRQVRRNIERFEGEDFMFELTKEELSRCQFGTLNSGRGSNIKYMPLAFTELGVAMLSSVLNSETAIRVNRDIMRVFAATRQLLLNLPIHRLKELEDKMIEMQQYIEDVFTDYNDINEDTRLQLEQINITLAEMQTQSRPHSKPRRKIGFYTEEQRKNNEDIIE